MLASDGHFIVSVGNDVTFEWCIEAAQRAAPEAAADKLLQDPCCKTAVGCVTNWEHAMDFVMGPLHVWRR